MHRADDIDTAVGASITALHSKASNQRLALMALYAAGENGLNDFELEDVTGVQQASIGKRRGELRDKGLVRRASDEAGNALSRPSHEGNPSAVWCLTAAGVIEAESLPAGLTGQEETP